MIKQCALPLALALSVGIGGTAPASAQAGSGGGTLIIYGNDRCPVNTICVRAPESDRYRIPQTLRSGTLAPAEQPWSARASSVSRAGAASGIGSCSTTGPGGSVGCWNKMMKDARDERKQSNAAAAASPEPR